MRPVRVADRLDPRLRDFLDLRDTQMRVPLLAVPR